MPYQDLWKESLFKALQSETGAEAMSVYVNVLLKAGSQTSDAILSSMIASAFTTLVEDNYSLMVAAVSKSSLFAQFVMSLTNHSDPSVQAFFF